MTFADALILVAQLVCVAAIGWVSADWLLALLRLRGGGAQKEDRATDEGWGFAECALAAIVGFLFFCIVAMVVHLVSGGAAFGTPFVLPGLALLLLAIRWRALTRFAPISWRPLLLAALILGALFVWPVIAGGPAARTGDTPWHLGWTQQLLHGEAVPTGPAPEVGRNAYPWGFHAVTATLVRLVPGSDPLTTHNTLHVVILAGIPLAAASIARRFDRTAGWPAAAAVSLIGGFGWVTATKFFTIPSEAGAGADLVVASPNSVYELLPPASPRELGLVVFGALIVMILVAADRGDPRYSFGSGAIAGLVGLVSVPLFLSCLVVGAVSVVAIDKEKRRPFAWRFFLTAVGVFAIWAGPVVRDYIEYEGFIDITPRLGMEWNLVTALASWGLLLPFALWGTFLVTRRSSVRPRLWLAYACAIPCLLFLSVLRSDQGWSLGGNATLLHQGRFWPAAHLLAAAAAGVALAFAGRALARRSQRWAAGGLALALCVGSISPVLASVSLARTMRAGDEGFVYGSPEFDPGSFARRAATHLDTEDVVTFFSLEVPSDPEIGLELRATGDRLLFLMFQLTGARVARYDDPRLERNDLRIRYRALAEEWDRRIAGAGFRATHALVVDPKEEWILLEEGEFGGYGWGLVELPIP